MFMLMRLCSFVIKCMCVSVLNLNRSEGEPLMEAQPMSGAIRILVGSTEGL